MRCHQGLLLSPTAPDQPLSLLALYGPTAAGKTALAVALRTAGWPVEAIVCDALQVYRDLDAATAKPTPAEQAALPHHLLDCVAPTEAMTAGRWAALAEVAAREVLARGAIPLLVGGTGLYLRALARGLAPIPLVPAALRQALAEQWDTPGGPQQLYAELSAADPAYAAKTPWQNRQRVLRALEVLRHTGRAFSDWHLAHQASPPRHHLQLIAVVPAVDRHLPRLQARAESMAEPLWHEVESLLHRGVPADAPGLQALGYRDALALRAAGLPASEALPQLRAALASAHKAYAKKQLTWLRSEAVTLQIDPDHPDALAALQTQLRGFVRTG